VLKRKRDWYRPLTGPTSEFERWEIRCPYCGHRHRHGAEPGERRIHRVQHCWLKRPPWANGYWLILPDGLNLEDDRQPTTTTTTTQGDDTMAQCKTCTFWRRGYDKTRRQPLAGGECRRHPPRVLNDGKTKFPATAEEAWCGEYRSGVAKTNG